MKTFHKLLSPAFSLLPARLIYETPLENPKKKDYDPMITAAMEKGRDGYTEKGWQNPEKANEEAREKWETLKAEIEQDKKTPLTPGTVDGKLVLGVWKGREFEPVTTSDGEMIPAQDDQGRLREGLVLADVKQARNLSIVDEGARTVRHNREIDAKVKTGEIEVSPQLHLVTADEIANFTPSERNAGDEKEYQARAETIAARFKSTPNDLRNRVLEEGYDTVYKVNVLGLTVDGEFIPVFDQNGQGVLPGEKEITWGQLMDYVYENQGAERRAEVEPVPEGFPRGYDRNKDKHFVEVNVYNTYELFPRLASFKVGEKEYMGEYLGLWKNGVFTPTLDGDGNPISPYNEKGELIRVTHGEAAQMKKRDWERLREGKRRVWEENEKGMRRWVKKEAKVYSAEEAEAYKHKRGPYVPVVYEASNGKKYWVLGENGQPVRNKEGKVIGAFKNGTFNDLTQQEVENYGVGAAKTKGGLELPLDYQPEAKPLSAEQLVERSERREQIKKNRAERDRQQKAWEEALQEGRAYPMPAREHFVRPKEKYTAEQIEDRRKNFFENEKTIEEGMDVIFDQAQTEVYAQFRNEHMSFKREDAKEWAIDLAELAFDLTENPRDPQLYETVFKYWVENVRKNVLVPRKKAGGKKNDYEHLLQKNIDFNNPDPDAIYLLYLAVNTLAAKTIDPAVFGYGTNYDIEHPDAMAKAMEEERRGSQETDASRNYGAEAIINGYTNILPRKGNFQRMAEDVMAKPTSSRVPLKTTLEALGMTQVVKEREAAYNAATPEERVKFLEEYKKQNDTFQQAYETLAQYAQELAEGSLTPDEERGIKTQILEHVNRVRESGVVTELVVEGGKEVWKPVVLPPLEYGDYWQEGGTSMDYFIENLPSRPRPGDPEGKQNLEDLYKNTSEDTEGGKSFREEIKKEMQARGYTFEANPDFQKQREWVRKQVSYEELFKNYWHDQDLIEAYMVLDKDTEAIDKEGKAIATDKDGNPIKIREVIANELTNRRIDLPPDGPSMDIEVNLNDPTGVTQEQVESYKRRKERIQYMIDNRMLPEGYGAMERDDQGDWVPQERKPIPSENSEVPTEPEQAPENEEVDTELI